MTVDGKKNYIIYTRYTRGMKTETFENFEILQKFIIVYDNANIILYPAIPFFRDIFLLGYGNKYINILTDTSRAAHWSKSSRIRRRGGVSNSSMFFIFNSQ